LLTLQIFLERQSDDSKLLYYNIDQLILIQVIMIKIIKLNNKQIKRKRKATKFKSLLKNNRNNRKKIQLKKLIKNHKFPQ
jgi:hypothetical protein